MLGDLQLTLSRSLPRSQTNQVVRTKRQSQLSWVPTCPSGSPSGQEGAEDTAPNIVVM